MSGAALIVFGDKTANEILPIVEQQYGDRFAEKVKIYFDGNTDSDSEFKRVLKTYSKVHYVIGVVDIHLRMTIENFAERFQLMPFTVVHHSAVVADSAKIGAGCFIAPQAVVSVNATVGDHSIVHIHSSIGHDSQLGKHCVILPGARISGEVCLGEGVLVGSNSFVFQKASVGDHSQIDALTYVKNDVASEMLVSGRIPKPVKRINTQSNE